MDGSGGGGGGGGSAGGGGGGAPAPFLQKTYDMVDDPDTDDIVSWTPEKDSFVVWKPPEFAARLLPSYFKHNNFSSFIRQLNTYGFRKTDPERWEFTNQDFIRGQRHLLKNIHRRKPVYSHNTQTGGELTDSERIVLESEIDRLSREKASLQASLLKFRQEQSGTKIQFDDLERRLADMEQRQLKMITFMQRAMQNPQFMDNLVKMASSTSVDFSFNRKRRLPPGLDYCQEPCENNFYDDHNGTSKSEIGNVLDREFCDKLKLELGSVIPDGKLVTSNTQNSNEGTQSSPVKLTSCGHETMECFPLVPESLELCDTRASICPAKNLSVPRAPDDGDGLLACQLSLALVSSAMQTDRREFPSPAPNSVDQEGTIDITDLRRDNGTAQSDVEMVFCKQATVISSVAAKVASLQDVPPPSNEVSATPPARVNDKFWEQFLTERPGSLDNEESSSGPRTNSEEQNIERKPEDENIGREAKGGA